MRVLVATEDRAERDIIAGALAERKVRKLLFAEDGVDAYAQVRRQEPDVVIVSAALPRIDGIVLARTLSRAPTFGASTLLILGDGCRSRVREALEARPSGILVRPFDGKTFLARLDAALAAGRPAPARAPSAATSH